MNERAGGSALGGTAAVTLAAFRFGIGIASTERRGSA